MTTVSVVLCTYNGARHLPVLLESLVAQRRPIDELIVADDCSSDQTLDVVESFRRKLAGRVVVNRNASNLGPAANFSQALARATGEWVLPCDQDDIWHAAKVDRLVSLLHQASGIDVLQHDGRLIDDRGQPLAGTLFKRLGVPHGATPQRKFMHLVRRNFAPGCTLAVRRALLERGLPVPTGFMHDEWLVLLAAGRGSLACVDEPLISYRVHSSNHLGLKEVGPWASLRGYVRGDVGQRSAKLQRLVALRHALSAGQVAGAERFLPLLDDAIVHLKRRSQLPSTRLIRVPWILGEVTSGRYGRWSSGLASALRDLLA